MSPDDLDGVLVTVWMPVNCDLILDRYDIGNESVSKIIINDTLNLKILFLKTAVSIW